MSVVMLHSQRLLCPVLYFMRYKERLPDRSFHNLVASIPNRARTVHEQRVKSTIYLYSVNFKFRLFSSEIRMDRSN